MISTSKRRVVQAALRFFIGKDSPRRHGGAGADTQNTSEKSHSCRVPLSSDGLCIAADPCSGVPCAPRSHIPARSLPGRGSAMINLAPVTPDHTELRIV